jgi:hypothetical protein
MDGWGELEVQSIESQKPAPVNLAGADNVDQSSLGSRAIVAVVGVGIFEFLLGWTTS